MDWDEWYRETCYNCGVQWCMRKAHQQQLLKSKANFHCPNGHAQHYCENEEDRLRRKVQNLEQQQARLEEEAKAARTLARREKTKRKKVETRAKAGVCLECHRSFQNVNLHMKTCHGKHKDEKVRVLPLP